MGPEIISPAVAQSLDPFRFVLIAWPGWMNDRQWLSKISFRFRINEFARLLRKVNSSCYQVKANCLTFGLNVRTGATEDVLATDSRPAP